MRVNLALFSEDWLNSLLAVPNVIHGQDALPILLTSPAHSRSLGVKIKLL